MAGIVNDVLYALNSDFTGGNSLLASESNGLVTNGQMWIGSTALNAGGTHINVGSITSPGGTITVGYSSPNVTLSVTNPGITQVVIQTFNISGANTYTPTAGMKYCIVECIGAGGGGGGAGATSAVQAAAAGGGGGGGYGRAVFSAATIGVSQSVTIGTGGAAGSTAPGSGGNGTNTIFGANLIVAAGGVGGTLSNAGVLSTVAGGAGGGVGLGTISVAGESGQPGFSIFSTTASFNSGSGGASAYGGGGASKVVSGAGITGGTPGGGGSGAATTNDIARAGGLGQDGYCIITEYI